MDKVQHPIILSVMHLCLNRFESKSDIGTEEYVEGTDLKRKRRKREEL
jgi:hypothetical protein